MNDHSTNVPIPVSEHLNAANPFDDQGSNLNKSPGRSPGTPTNPQTVMGSGSQMQNMVDMLSPPMKMESHSPGHYPMQSQSPSMSNPQVSNGPGGHNGPMGFPGHMGHPQGGHPQSWNQAPMGMGGSNYRPNMMNQRFGSMPGMPHQMQPGRPGMPGMQPGPPGMQPGMNPNMDRLNGPQNQFSQSFMNSMPPGMFPNSPHGQFAAQQSNVMASQQNVNPTQTQPNPPSNNTESEVGEILALFDDSTMHNNSSQVKNEPTQCGVCKQQIYPTQEIEELVRCFSCKTWYKRNCVGITESAYKQLVLEQNYCAWSCQTCITNKVVNSCVQKVPNDNNNSTNQPIPPNAPVHDVPIKPEKERKKRKNSKTNGKGKAPNQPPPNPAPSGHNMGPPMGMNNQGMDPRFRGMNPNHPNHPMMMGPGAGRMMGPGGPQMGGRGMNPMMMGGPHRMGGMPPGAMPHGMMMRGPSGMPGMNMPPMGMPPGSSASGPSGGPGMAPRGPGGMNMGPGSHGMGPGGPNPGGPQQMDHPNQMMAQNAPMMPHQSSSDQNHPIVSSGQSLSNMMSTPHGQMIPTSSHQSVNSGQQLGQPQHNFPGNQQPQMSGPNNPLAHTMMSQPNNMSSQPMEGISMKQEHHIPVSSASNDPLPNLNQLTNSSVLGGIEHLTGPTNDQGSKLLDFNPVSTSSPSQMPSQMQPPPSLCLPGSGGMGQQISNSSALISSNSVTNSVPDPSSMVGTVPISTPSQVDLNAIIGSIGGGDGMGENTVSPPVSNSLMPPVNTTNSTPLPPPPTPSLLPPNPSTTPTSVEQKPGPSPPNSVPAPPTQIPNVTTDNTQSGAMATDSNGPTTSPPLPTDTNPPSKDTAEQQLPKEEGVKEEP